MPDALDHHATHPVRIAIVEDDADQSASMAEYLTMQGYNVWTAESAAGFYRELVTHPVDVVLLDIGLPEEDGLSIARHVKETGIGIIIVSARSHLDDRLTGLDSGADIYLTKPVDLRELVAHIEALWRRLAADNDKPATAASGGHSSWYLLREERRLLTPDREWVDLTPNEFAFMECLVDGGGEVSRHDVAAVLSNEPSNFSFHRIDVLISRLRKKVESHTTHALPLATAPRQRLELTRPVATD